MDRWGELIPHSQGFFHCCPTCDALLLLIPSLTLRHGAVDFELEAGLEKQSLVPSYLSALGEARYPQEA